MLGGCSTPVQFTLYEDGTKHYDFDPDPAPTNKVEVGRYEAIHNPPMKTRLTIVAGYTIGLPITLGRDIASVATGEDLAMKQDVKMCLAKNGCVYSPEEGSEKRIE